MKYLELWYERLLFDTYGSIQISVPKSSKCIDKTYKLKANP